MRDHNAIVVGSVYAFGVLLILISRARSRSLSKRAARFEQTAQRLPGSAKPGDELARKRDARRGGRDLAGHAGRSPSPAAASPILPDFVRMIVDNVASEDPGEGHRPSGARPALYAVPNDAA